MANTTELENLMVRFLGDATDYLKMLKDAAKETKETVDEVKGYVARIEQFGDSLKSFANQAAAALGSLGAARFLKDALANFQQAESVSTKLTATLEANGREVASTKAAYEEYAVSVEKITTLEDDFVASLLNTAETYELTGKAAQNAVDSAIAFAAATGGSEQTFIRMAAALEKGDIELAMHMSRLIPQLRGVKDESEFVAKAQQLMAAGMRAARAEMETSSGQMKMLQRDWGNLKEELGKFIADGVKPVVTILRDMIQAFRALPDPIKAFTTGMLALTTAIVASVAVSALAMKAFASLKVELAAVTAFMAANPIIAWGIAISVAATMVFQLGKAIIDAEKASSGLNEELEREKTLLEDIAKLERKRTTGKVEEGKKIEDPVEAQKFFEEALREASKQVEDYKKKLEDLEEAQRKMARREGDLNNFVTRYDDIINRVEQYKEKLKGAQESQKQLKAEFDAFTAKKLEDDIKAVNKQLEFQNELVNENIKRMEQGLTPLDKDQFKLRKRATPEMMKKTDVLTKDLEAAKKFSEEQKSAVQFTKQIDDEVSKLKATIGKGLVPKNDEEQRINEAEATKRLTAAQAEHAREALKEKEILEDRKKAGLEMEGEIKRLEKEIEINKRLIASGQAGDEAKMRTKLLVEGMSQADVDHLKILQDTIAAQDKAMLSAKAAEAERKALPGEIFNINKSLDREIELLEQEALTGKMTADQRKIFEAAQKGATLAEQQDMLVKAEKKRLLEEVQVPMREIQKNMDIEMKLLQEEARVGKMSNEQKELYKLMLKATTEEQKKAIQAQYEAATASAKQLKDQQEITRLTEEFMSPLDKYNKRLKELDGLKAAGLSQEIYNKALQKAQKEFDGATAAAQKFDAALAGSAEAKARIKDYVNIFRGGDGAALMGKGGKGEASTGPKVVKGITEHEFSRKGEGDWNFVPGNQPELEAFRKKKDQQAAEATQEIDKWRKERNVAEMPMPGGIGQEEFDRWKERNSKLAGARELGKMRLERDLPSGQGMVDREDSHKVLEDIREILRQQLKKDPVELENADLGLAS